MEENYNSFQDLVSCTDRRKSMRQDDELVELLWQDGHVVMNSQTNRRTVPNINEAKQVCHKTELHPKWGGHAKNSNSLIREDETAPWLEYLLGDSVEKDYCSEFFYGMTGNDALNKAGSDTNLDGKCVEFGPFKQISATNATMMPPQVPRIGSTGTRGIANFSHFSGSTNDVSGSTDGLLHVRGVENTMPREVGECSSTMTKISSNWKGYPHVQSQPNLHDTLLRNGLLDEVTRLVEDTPKEFQECRQTEGHRVTATNAVASSGGSRSSIGRTTQETSRSQKCHKRKERRIEESECQSEDTEYESVDVKDPPQRSASTRRSRSAEVHNLSERRRRDRINEKMKALQELIPNCNKTDKASMLDEVIEYLKSLQLQVQLMWMGNSMVPMMFPNVQHYLSSLSMGMQQGSLPSLSGPLQMPRIPLLDRSMLSTNTNIPNAYARFLGFNHMLPQPAAANSFNSGSLFQAMMPIGSNQPSEAPSEQIKNGKKG